MLSEELKKIRRFSRHLVACSVIDPATKVKLAFPVAVECTYYDIAHVLCGWMTEGLYGSFVCIDNPLSKGFYYRLQQEIQRAYNDDCEIG